MMKAGARIMELMTISATKMQVSKKDFKMMVKICKAEKNKMKKSACKSLLKVMSKNRKKATFVTNEGLAAYKNVVQTIPTASCLAMWRLSLDQSMVPKEDKQFCQKVKADWRDECEERQ